MKIEDVLSPTLGELEFDRNAHLFQWSGALIEGIGKPVRTDQPEVIEAPSLKDFRYHQREESAFPFVDRNRPDNPVPTVSARAMREKLLGDDKPSLSREQEEFARPNAAAAFDLLQQTAWEHGIENPYLPEMLAFSRPENVNEDPYYEGAAWVFSEISKLVLDFALLKLSLIQVLDIPASATALRAHLLNNTPLERVEAIIEQFQGRDFAQMVSAANAKIERIHRQHDRWRAAGQTPVLVGSGELNEILTLTNVATMVCAMRKLNNLAIGIYSFKSGARQALEALSSAES